MGARKSTSSAKFELAKTIWRHSIDHNVLGAAAELAYYFMLSLFPMLIFLTSLVSFLSGPRDSILGGISKVMPPDAFNIVRAALDDAVSNRGGGLLSIGILGTIWAASAGVSALIGTLNTVFDVKETRSYWRVKAIAIALTLAISLLAMDGVVLVMFGDRFGNRAAAQLGLGNAMTLILNLLNYVIGFVLLLAGIQVTYYFGPNRTKEWRWITPGAVFAVLAGVAVSATFSIYLRFAPSYSATYGGLGAVIVLMLWLYLMGLMIMLGAEINSEREKTEG